DGWYCFWSNVMSTSFASGFDHAPTNIFRFQDIRLLFRPYQRSEKHVIVERFWSVTSLEHHLQDLSGCLWRFLDNGRFQPVTEQMAVITTREHRYSIKSDTSHGLDIGSKSIYHVQSLQHLADLF